MKPIDFPEKNVVFAENQPEYIPLPAHRTPDGDVITCWELSEEEILKIATTGELWLNVKTFNNPLQPLFITVHKSDIFNPENLEQNPNESQTQSQNKTQKKGLGFMFENASENLTDLDGNPNEEEILDQKADLVECPQCGKDVEEILLRVYGGRCKECNDKKTF